MAQWLGDSSVSGIVFCQTSLGVCYKSSPVFYSFKMEVDMACFEDEAGWESQKLKVQEKWEDPQQPGIEWLRRKGLKIWDERVGRKPAKWRLTRRSGKDLLKPCAPLRPGSDAVLHINPIKYEFRPTQVINPSWTDSDTELNSVEINTLKHTMAEEN